MKRKILTLSLVLAGCGGGSGPAIDNNATTKAVNSIDHQALANKSAQLGPLRSHTASPISAELVAFLNETNKLRAEKGLAPLTFKDSLNSYAALRAREVSEKFSHDRPDGSPSIPDDLSSVFTTYGDVAAGENLYGSTKANGLPGAAEAVAGFKSSPGHYANIIDKDFDSVGLAYYHNPGTLYQNHWVQIFGGGQIQSKLRDPARAVSLDREALDKSLKENLRFNGDRSLNLPGNELNDGVNRRGLTVQLNDRQRYVLRAPADFGWRYQTIGELQQDQLPVAYLNLGQPFIPRDTSALQGHYVGQAVGDWGGHSRVLAAVSGDVNFSGADKSLHLQLSNSQRANYDLALGTRGTLAADSALDFQDKLQWNSASGAFESASGRAQFYGNGQELGGLFQREVRGESYQGSYGAQRQ